MNTISRQSIHSPNTCFGMLPRCKQFPYFSYLFRGQFTSSSSLPTRTPRVIRPAFSSHVAHIRGVVPQPQMAWSYALSVIARMTDKLIGWYGAIMESVRKSVCSEALSFDSEMPITISKTAYPLPTPFILSHKLPEPWYRVRVNSFSRIFPSRWGSHDVYHTTFSSGYNEWDKRRK